MRRYRSVPFPKGFRRPYSRTGPTGINVRPAHHSFVGLLEPGLLEPDLLERCTDEALANTSGGAHAGSIPCQAQSL